MKHFKYKKSWKDYYKKNSSQEMTAISLSNDDFLTIVLGVLAITLSLSIIF